MWYVYIFDHLLGHIYEIAIDKEEIEDLTNVKVEQYLYKNYHIKSKNISYMISHHKLEIERIEKQ